MPANDPCIHGRLMGSCEYCKPKDEQLPHQPGWPLNLGPLLPRERLIVMAAHSCVDLNGALFQLEYSPQGSVMHNQAAHKAIREGKLLMLRVEHLIGELELEME